MGLTEQASRSFQQAAPLGMCWVRVSGLVHWVRVSREGE